MFNQIEQISCNHLILHDVSTDQISQMTLDSFRSCKVSPQNEFLNALAMQMDGQMTWNTVSSWKVYPQNEFLNFSSKLDAWEKDFEHWEQL